MNEVKNQLMQTTALIIEVKKWWCRSVTMKNKELSGNQAINQRGLGFLAIMLRDH